MSNIVCIGTGREIRETLQVYRAELWFDYRVQLLHSSDGDDDDDGG